MFLTFYIFGLYGNFLIDLFLEYKLNQFDLNSDSFFSLQEQTDEQKEYMNLFINDTARNLFFITGIFFSFIISGITYILMYIYSYIFEKSKTTL